MAVRSGLCEWGRCWEVMVVLVVGVPAAAVSIR